ncbi:MAG: phosphoribosyltransferase [Sulfurovaceae bacterium]|nr:phosphoribosyltransferase [Sulfurovaceae bacterium]
MELLSEYRLGYIEDEIVILTWEMFEQLANIISNDIKNNFHNKKICLLGVARGALPLLTYVSHHTEIRDISIIQLKMTNSNKPFDYGEVSTVLQAIRNDYDNFIILEDIIYKGKTVRQVEIELLKQKKKILAIYSLTIDEQYSHLIKSRVKVASILKQDKWIKFPWEK